MRPARNPGDRGLLGSTTETSPCGPCFCFPTITGMTARGGGKPCPSDTSSSKTLRSATCRLATSNSTLKWKGQGSSTRPEVRSSGQKWWDGSYVLAIPRWTTPWARSAAKQYASRGHAAPKKRPCSAPESRCHTAGCPKISLVNVVVPGTPTSRTNLSQPCLSWLSSKPNIPAYRAISSRRTLRCCKAPWMSDGAELAGSRDLMNSSLRRMSLTRTLEPRRSRSAAVVSGSRSHAATAESSGRNVLIPTAQWSARVRSASGEAQRDCYSQP